MSSTVENKVVNMQFNNAQFEAGVQQTLTSLESLKASLKFDGATKGLSSIQSAVNTFSLVNISNAVEALSNKFSTLGIVGMSALQNITNEAMNLVKGNKIFSAISMATNQIKTGGWNRAQSVAQARFTLQGLLNDEIKVEAAFDKAKEAVDGTAYSMDAAVSAASQLVASGLDIETELGGSLKAIAGTAAMTNRDFSDIAHIFTTIAGNGRVMGMQLTQLSTYGLNAAATLGQFGKYAGSTEAEIRELVSKGEISFEDFSEAMELAFGDHAKAANETLTGVLNNTKSALSRIGEVFASGIIENKDFIQFIDYARQGINRIKDSVANLQEPFKNLITALSNFGKRYTKIFTNEKFRFSGLETAIGLIQKAMEFVTDLINKFNELKTEIEDEIADNPIVEAATAMEDAATKLAIAKEIWETGVWGNGQNRIDKITEAFGEGYAEDVQALVNAFVYGGYSWEAAMELAGVATDEAMSDASEAMEEAGETAEETSVKAKAIGVAVATISLFGDKVKTVFNSIKNVVTKVGTSFKKVFSWGKLHETLEAFSTIFGLWSYNLAINEERAAKLEIVFTALWSVLDLLRTAVIAIAKGFATIFSSAAGSALDLVLNLASKVGEAVIKFNEWVTTNHFLQRAVSFLTNSIANAIAYVKEFFTQLMQLPAVQKIKERLLDLATTIQDKIIGKFTDAKDGVGKFFSSLEDEDGSGMKTVLDNINSALEKLLEFVDKVTAKFNKVKDFYDKNESALSDFGVKFDDFKTKLSNTKIAAESLKNSTSLIDFASKVTDIFTAAGVSIGGFGSNLLSIFSNLDTAKLMVFGFAGSLTTLFFSLSYTATTLGDFIKAAKGVPASLSGVFKSLSNFINGYTFSNRKAAQAKVIKAYALAIAVLAASLIALTFVDEKKLEVAYKALAVLLGIMVIGVKIMANTAKKVTDAEALAKALNALSIMFVAIAGSVFLIAEALKVLAELNWDKSIIAPIIALVVIMGSLIGISLLLAKYAPTLSMGGLGLISYAAAVWILVQALKSLETLDIDNIVEKLAVVAAALLAVGVIALLASGLSFSGGVGVLLIILSIYLIESELMMICDIGVSWNELQENLDRFLIIVGMLVLIGLTLRLSTGEGVVKAAASILLVAVSLYVIVRALLLVVSVAESGHLWDGMNAIIGLMVSIIALLAVLAHFGTKTLNKAGWTMIGISISIAILAAIAYMLKDLDYDAFWNGFKCLGLMVLLEMALIWITQFGKDLSPKTLITMTVCVMMLTILATLLSYMEDPSTLIAPTLAIMALLLSLGTSLYLAGKEAEKVKTSAVVAMVVALAIACAGLYILATQPWDRVLVGAAAISLILLTLGYALSQVSAFKGSLFTTSSLEAIAMMVASIGIIAASLYVLTMVGGTHGIASMAVAAITIIAVLAAVIEALWALNDIKFGVGGVIDKTVFIMIAEMIVSIVLISVALSILVATMGDDTGIALEAAASIGVILLALVASLAIIDKYANTISTRSLVAIGLMGAIVVAIALSLKAILDGEYTWDEWQRTIFGLASCMLVLLSVMVLISTITAIFRGKAIVGVVMFALLLSTIALTMAPIAAAVYILVEAVKELTTVEWEKIDIIKIYLLITALYLIAGACVVGAAGLIVLSLGIAAVAAIFMSALAPITLMVVTISNAVSVLSVSIKVLGEAISQSADNISSGLTKITVAFAKSLALFLSTINSNRNTIIQSIKNIIVTAIENIAEGIVEVTETILNGILSFLSVLDEKGNLIIGKVLEIIVNTFKTIASKAYAIGYYGSFIAISFVYGIITGINSSIDGVVEAFVGLAVSALSSFAAALAENSDLIFDSFGILALGLGRMLLSAINFSGWADDLIAEYDAEIEYQKQKIQENGLVTGASYDESVADGVESGSTEVGKTVSKNSSKWFDVSTITEKLGNGSASTFTDSIKNTLSGDTSVGKSITNLFSSKNVDTEEIKKSADEVASNAKSLYEEGWRIETMHIDNMNQEAIQVMLDNGWQYSDYSRSVLVRYFQEGIDDTELDFSEPFLTGEDDLLNMMNDSQGDFYSNGFDLGGDGWGQGYGDGIISMKDYIYDASWEATGAAEEGARDRTQTESPSKVGYSLGKFWDMGIANGISDFGSLVYSASSSMAGNLLDTTAGMMALVNNIVNDNLALEPTISPVVDSNSLNTLNSTFGVGNLGIAATAAMSVTDASENSLAAQVASLSEQVKKLADQDYSKLLDGVAINVDASTNVDGTALRQTSSRYTIQQINDRQRSYAMAIGGKI